MNAGIARIKFSSSASWCSSDCFRVVENVFQKDFPCFLKGLAASSVRAVENGGGERFFLVVLGYPDAPSKFFRLSADPARNEIYLAINSSCLKGDLATANNHGVVALSKIPVLNFFELLAGCYYRYHSCHLHFNYSGCIWSATTSPCQPSLLLQPLFHTRRARSCVLRFLQGRGFPSSCRR